VQTHGDAVPGETDVDLDAVGTCRLRRDDRCRGVLRWSSHQDLAAMSDDLHAW
jgi:hypothetical protein